MQTGLELNTFEGCVLMFSVIGVMVAVCYYVCSYYQHKAAILYHACTKSHPMDDAIKSATAIGYFLGARRQPVMIMFCYDELILGYDIKMAEDVFKGKEGVLIHFIHILHSLGCELVVRTVNDDSSDIEEGAPSKLRTLMRQEFAKAQKEKFDYTGCHSGHFGPYKSVPDFFEPGGILDTLYKAGKLDLNGERRKKQ